MAYSELPPKEDILVPFEEVSVDLIGPWNVNVPNFGGQLFPVSGTETAIRFQTSW